jgi:opacity protein-like surface antigen
MAVRTLHVLVCGLLGCIAPALACAEESGGPWVRELWQQGEVKLHELRDFLGRQLKMTDRDEPEWLLDLSQETIDPGNQPGTDAAQLVVQQDRRDGTDLLTLRYPLAQRGGVRAYAGAGLNQAVYFAESSDGPTLLTRRERHRSVGAAAEVGAEFRVSQQLMVNAELRWADLDTDAVLLRSQAGFVGADPLSVGVSVGWRFR